jgi:hypothetical protein
LGNCIDSVRDCSMLAPQIFIVNIVYMGNAKETGDRAVLPEGSDAGGSPSSEKKRVAAMIMDKFGVEDVSKEHLSELGTFLESLDLAKNPDAIKNPDVLRTVAEKLEAWGYKHSDIHDKSLVLADRTDIESAEINRLITSAKEPTGNYPSNVGVYHLTVNEKDGKRVYRKTAIDKLTGWVETMLWKLGDLKGGNLSRLFSSPLRRKGRIGDIAENINRLGLNAHFSVEGDTVVEDVSDIRRGAMLDDLLRLRGEQAFLQGGWIPMRLLQWP